MHICIGTYKPDTATVNMLQSLAESDLPNELETVWLIENGTETPGFQIPESVSRALPIEHHALAEAGVARSRQWLVEKLNSGLIVFFDDDISVDKRLLSTYSKIVGAYGCGHFFGGVVHAAQTQPPPDWLSPYMPASIRGWQTSIDEFNQLSNPWFLGANFCAFAEDILNAGGFDLRFGPGSSMPGTFSNPTRHEMVMQRRLAAIGCKPVYVPEAVVTHYASADCYTEEWILHRRYRNALTEGILYGDRHPGKPPRWMWKKMAALWVRAQVARTCSDPAFRFARMSDFSHWKGFVNGIGASARMKCTDATGRASNQHLAATGLDSSGSGKIR